MTDNTQVQFQLDAIADEFLARRRDGQSPTIQEYQVKFPAIAELIKQTLETIQFVDNLNDFEELTCADSQNTAGNLARSQPELKDYRIVRKVGQGGMGVVYEAKQESLDRRVALKILPNGIAKDGKFIERFKREARAAAKLHHTNIVPVYDVGQDGEVFYYTMQFIDGLGLDEVKNEVIRLEQDNSDASQSSISQLISGSNTSANSSSTKGKQSYFKSIAKLGASVAEALGYAHERNIVHRDVKPSNLILDTAGVVWLADFGLAKTTDSDLTETGDFLGTARYMSPERFKGRGDHRGDIYGLGVTLYELVTLTNAFEANDRLRLMDQIANHDPRKPSDIKRNIPLDLETIILKSMEKEPKRRYQTASDLADDLRRFADDQPIHARRANSLERIARWMRRHKAQTAAMISMAIAIAALVVGTLLIQQQRNIALTNELKAKAETVRADKAAEQAEQSADVTIQAMTTLVESVRTELRNHPELLPLKRRILTNAENKLNQLTELTGQSTEIITIQIQALISMARINFEIGSYEKAQKYFADALFLTDQLREKNHPEKLVLMNRSKIYSGLGALMFDQHLPDETRNYFQLAYDNDQEWLKLDPNDVQAKTGLAKSADDLADTYVLLNERNWDQAEKLHQQAYDIRKSFRSNLKSNFQVNHDFCVSHMKLGDMPFGRATHNKLSDDEFASEMVNARKWFKGGLEIAEQMIETFPDDNIVTLQMQAALCERFADTLDDNEAHEYYMKSIEIREGLSPRLQMDRNFQRNLAVAWGRAAVHLYRQQNVEEAVTYMEKCLTKLQELTKRIPDDTGLLVDEMMTHFQMGRILPDDDPRKMKAWGRAKSIGDQLVENQQIPADYVIMQQLESAIERFHQRKSDE